MNDNNNNNSNSNSKFIYAVLVQNSRRQVRLSQQGLVGLNLKVIMIHRRVSESNRKKEKKTQGNKKAPVQSHTSSKVKFQRIKFMSSRLIEY